MEFKGRSFIGLSSSIGLSSRAPWLTRLTSTLLCTLLITGNVSAHELSLSETADPTFETHQYDGEQSTSSDPTSEELDSQISDVIKERIKNGTYFILGIQSRLDESADELDSLKLNINALERRVVESSHDLSDLQEQLDNLQNLAEDNTKKIIATRRLIAESKNTIVAIESRIRDNQAVMEATMREFKKALTVLYTQTNLLYLNGKNSPDLLLVLAGHERIGDILTQQGMMKNLEAASKQLAIKVLETEEKLRIDQNDRQIRREKLLELETLLAQEKRMLQSAQEAKQRLLTETQGRQDLYEHLLEIARKDAVNISQEIRNLQANQEFFNEKLAELKTNGASATSAYTPDMILSESQALKALRGKTPLAWPVSPYLGISAFFHDESYRAALGVQHNAVDIRQLQGSKVRSAADGVVSKAADNGFGYSYIIITHPDGLMTLYGHISEILIKEGELVRQGQVIGLSGGMPGTKGAGWLTTGPHLHLEVFKNYKHTNPLLYLPLEYLPVSTLQTTEVQNLIKEKISVPKN